MKKNMQWWQKSVIYQIYPKSFQDSTGNGTGDLLGISKRLDYIKFLGVDAIWIAPFYMSPQIDHGYDISDYKSIDPMYGTLNDFDYLVEEVHKRNLRIILDMVFNHSSTKHYWFIEAQKLNNSYRDYYIWKNPDQYGGPPNNWKSKFGGNAWSFDEKSKQYYMHLWTSKQADLNWENQNLRLELKNIMHYWADRGIDGIRLDVINLVSKPQDFPNDVNGKDGLRLYTDGPKIHKYIQEMNQDIFTPRKLMTVGEMSSSTIEHCQKYSALKGNELSMVFSFDHVEVDFYKNKKWTLKRLNLVKLKAILNIWQKGMYNTAWNALFWCNHDQPRIVSRWGDEGKYRVQSAKLFAMILHGMQGTPYIYQGEELGMINPKFNCINEYRDVESYNIYSQLVLKRTSKRLVLNILKKKSRDNSRTPMQWDESKYAGFTKGIPWIGMGKNSKNINVKTAISDKNSVLYTYKKLISLRKKYNILTFGDYVDLLKSHHQLWCYTRTYKKETLLVTANCSQKKVIWKTDILSNTWKILVNNYSDVITNNKSILLRPYEAIWWYKK